MTTATRTFIGYYRVSTAQQGASGLGLEAQRSSVLGYLSGVEGQLVAEFTEVETGKGANALSRRPQLRAALDACRKTGATLLIAKLDRLARNVHFVSGLLEAGCDFVAVDLPNANKTMLQIFAAMSEWERDQISARTKAALAAAKARGVKLGVKGRDNAAEANAMRRVAALEHADRLRDQLSIYLCRGYSQRQIADALNELGLKTRGGGSWSQKQVQRVIMRLDLRTTSNQSAVA
jgi:DNA invertase Pin-like site-specific DNA recombinase